MLDLMAKEDLIKAEEYKRLQKLSNDNMKIVFESIPAIIIISDISGRIKLRNKKAADIFGNKVNDMAKIICSWEKVKITYIQGKIHHNR